MKKSELYKIVKEALNEVLQEQRAQRLLKPDPDRKQRDPRDPKDPIRPKAVTLTPETNRLFFYTEDCQEIQVDDYWVCGGWHNENSGTQFTTFNIPYTDGEITFTNGQGYPCYTPSSNVTVTDFTNWLATTSPFGGATSEESLEILGYNSANEVSEGCVGCNVEFSNSTNDEAIQATNYSASLLDSALADVSYCIYPGCTDSTAINHNANANTNDGTCEYDQGEGDPGCTQTWSNNYSEDAEVENGSCSSYLVGGCTNDYYVEGQSVTDESGQISYPNQSQDIQTAVAEAQAIVDAYNTQYEGSATVNIVDAPVVDNDLASNYYCITEANFGCTDPNFDNYIYCVQHTNIALMKYTDFHISIHTV